jgi:hypothetical protein
MYYGVSAADRNYIISFCFNICIGKITNNTSKIGLYCHGKGGLQTTDDI